MGFFASNDSADLANPGIFWDFACRDSAISDDLEGISRRFARFHVCSWKLGVPG
jgi:hypothetical protein